MTKQSLHTQEDILYITWVYFISWQFFPPHLSCGSFSVSLQSPEGVPVSHGSADPIHDQLEGSVPLVHHTPDCALVPGGVDVGRVPEP